MFLGIAKGDDMNFAFETYDAMTIRENPTTQVAIQIPQWPENTFRLWMPEAVGELWQQWDPDVAHQYFTPTKRGGLLWNFEGNPDCVISDEMTPKGNSLLLEVSVTNRADHNLEMVYAHNCLHFSAASDFACEDFSRIYIRTNAQWRSLASLSPTCACPFYYCEGYSRWGRIDPHENRHEYAKQSTAADHPLIVCVSKDGKRAVGTASEKYEFLFHNGEVEYLLCIHSESGAVPTLKPAETVTFRQKIYFVAGGLMDCVAAFEADIEGDIASEYKFRD